LKSIGPFGRDLSEKPLKKPKNVSDFKAGVSALERATD